MSAATSVQVQIEESFVIDVSAEWLRRHALATLEAEGFEGGILTLVVTDDKTLLALNQSFLNIDAPTDVLSFGGESPDFVNPPHADLYLGDVVISYPRAKAQARAASHSIQEELALLVVHGVLHLLGYDHVRPEDQVAMWKRQAEILSGLGINHVQSA
jgi:probable rRNA maturation factor